MHWRDFIHHEAVRTRAQAVLIAVIGVFLIVMSVGMELQPIRSAGAGWVSTLLFIIALAMCGGSAWIWTKAPSISPRRSLPDSAAWKGPNHIALTTRVVCSTWSIAVATYATIGLVANDIYLPGKRGDGIHFHGLSAWFAYGAFMCAAISLASVVVDHYDRRNNERGYADIIASCEWVGTGLLALAFATNLLLG
jgi:hypothetical protein